MAADDSEVDVLLVEDNPNDAELTMRALRSSIRSEVPDLWTVALSNANPCDRPPRGSERWPERTNVSGPLPDA